MGYVTERNNVTIHGQGDKPIVFARGFGCDQNMWRFVAPHFTDDYKVILFDFTGSGRSLVKEYDSEKYQTLSGYAEDLLDVCHELDLKNTIVVGHSVSATIATLASLQSPDIFSALIHICPSPSFLNDPPDYIGGFEYSDLQELLDLMDKNYVGWAKHLAPIVMGESASELLTGELSDSFCSTDPIVAKNFARATFLSDNRESFRQCHVPSHIVQSEVDALASLDVGHYLHKITPNSRITVIESEGHCPHMTHPGITSEAIAQYLISE